MAENQRFTENEVTVVNPETGQVLTTTDKIFRSIYRDKGFELANQASAAKATAANASRRISGEKRRNDEPSITGGAAGMAAQLGIDNAGSDVIDEDEDAGSDDDGDGNQGGNEINSNLASAVDSKSDGKAKGNLGGRK